MDIQRDRLIRELEAFALSGSGIVVGLPGVGKTHSFRRLDSALKDAGTSCLYMPVDRLDVESDDDLQTELGIKEGPVTYLEQNIDPSGPSRGVLLIDAFDAARSARSQRTLLRLIQRVHQELAESWNVVASVRTYDARKSQELQGLFPQRAVNPPTDDFQLDGVHCRHFAIPELTDDEVASAVQTIPGLAEVYRASSDDFRSLLRIPFHLWLLEQLLRDNTEIPELSSVASEVQLLGLFWRHRVLGGSEREGKRVLLAKIAGSLVCANVLSVRKENVFEFVAAGPWDLLLSSDVLAYTSSSEQRIAFSHNILFDYAVSVLLIDDDPAELVEFISTDPSRPLFLRPSLVYYLTRLWYDAPEVFWKVFWHLVPLGGEVHVRVFARLLPTGVIASEARNIEQLQPLVDALQQSEPHAPQAVLRLLQALSMLSVRRDALWVSFLGRAANTLNRQFAWNAATFATEIAKRAKESGDNAVWTACGQVSRSLAGWFWSEMDQSRDTWLSDLGGHWVLPLVAETYATNVVESRELLRRALQLVGEDAFPVGLFRAVVYGVEKVYPCDPEFAGEVYEKAFSYYETSDQTTHMDGRVIAFTSTRRQDYELCQYTLIEQFPQFLRSAPMLACQAMVRSLNYYVVGRHVIGHLKEGATLEELQQQFQFGGTTVVYVTDMSFIWDSMSHHHEPMRMADDLFDYVGELAQQPGRREQIASLVGVIRSNACVAFFWRRLLAAASRFPDVFSEMLFDLCLARPLQTGSDTIYELGSFLEAASRRFSRDQLLRVEQSIVAIPEGASADEQEYLTHCRDRLLARIPSELLATAEGKRIREEMERADSLPENRPPVTWSGFTSREYTEEMWLQEHGVDVARPEHQSLLAFSKELDSFSSKWLNEKPPTDAIAVAMPIAVDAHNALLNGREADETVLESLRTKLGTFAHTVSRAATVLDADQFSFCRQVLLTCAADSSPRPDPARDFDHPGWSPAPRIEAAEGLPWLAAHEPDDEILDAVRQLASDPVPPVRFLLLTEVWRIFPKNPQLFWEIIEGRVGVERNQLVVHALLNSLSYVVGQAEERTVRALGQLAERMLPQEEADVPLRAAESTGILQDMVPLAAWLLLVRGDSWAEGFAHRLLEHPIDLAEAIDELNSEALNYLWGDLDPESNDVAARAASLAAETITAASAGIATLRAVPQDQWNDDLTSRMRATYSTIDDTISRIFFALRSDRQTTKLSREFKQPDELARLYAVVRPMLEQILTFASDEHSGVMFASTAHTYMQILNGLLRLDPAGALCMANKVVQSSRQAEYYLDSMAIGEVVELVEAILADYRDVVRCEDSLADLLSLLDTFADVGWSEALRLVWRLDEVFR